METSMISMLRTFLIVLLALGSKAALASSAQELLSSCRPIAKADVRDKYVWFPPTYQTGTCWGAFYVIQKVIVHVDDSRLPIYGVCAPSSSTLTQLISIYVAYAEKNPQRLHEDFFDVALESLQNAFPCKGRK